MDDATDFDPAEGSDQLFIWFQSLPLFNSYGSIYDLSDGEAILEALQRIDDAEFTDLSGSSEKQVDFHRTLCSRMVEYIEDKQPELQKQSGRTPLRELELRFQGDVDAGGIVATSRLLQLLLVCAVLSPDKEDYIRRIQQLDESVAVVISNAIVQILPVGESPDEMVSTTYSADENYDCDKCSTLQAEMSHINDEKKKLKAANVRLKSELDLANDIENEKSPSNRRFVHIQKENASLKDSLEKTASSRDELRTQCLELRDQLTSAIVETEQLTRKLTEIDKLREEVLEWKQTASQLTKFETEVKIYKRKLDDVGGLRQQLKTVEFRNTELMTRNLELEQENAQLDAVTAEADSLRSKLDRQEQDHKLASKRLESVSQEMLGMKQQIASLERERTKMEKQQTTDHNGLDEYDDGIPVGFDLGSELLPPSVKEDMLRLKMENAELEAKLKAQAENPRSVEKALAQNDHCLIVNGPKPKDNCDTDRFADLLAERDAQIEMLEKEKEVLRQSYIQQQQLITTAWYRQNVKMEQQAMNVRIQSAATNSDQPRTFLSDQRQAVNAPVSSGSRSGPNHASYRAASGSFFR